ncbi:MAG: type II secretion system protein, partial [Candidatus Pacebacteria bacterium]|nr:type II secretion system protein [Candidatus Paceibacterota bacterium]
KKTPSGFTLIELWVVIAIIGIRSSVVLASLTSARSKGQAAAVQAQLSNMRAQAELYYSNNNNAYGTAANCTSGQFSASAATGGLANLVAGVTSQSGATLTCFASTTAWSAFATIAGNQYCVDSTGKSTASTTETGAMITANANLCI